MGYSQFIKVYNVIHENPLTCAIDEETRAEDIVIDLCKKLNIKPVARHLFSLCIHNSKEWVMPFVKLFDSETKVFDFRLRFKIPNFSNLRHFDLEAHNYYFHQARYDLLSSKVSEISCENKKGELLGMGVADMYRVILETGVARDAVESDYKKFIPKEVYKFHLFFCKNAMHKKLDIIIDSCNQGKDLDRALYVKDLYLKQLEDLAPNYLCEEYRASVNEAGVIKRVNIHINPYDTKFPGIKCIYDGQKDWVQVCSIEELCFITVRSDKSMEIARKNGIPIYFNFSSITSMFSLVSLLDGYYRLGVKWTFSLSKDLLTPSLERLHAIKCHGPVGGEFSYSKLEKLRSNKPGCYILRESELAYDQYYLDVCIENSSKPTTFKIEKCLAGDGWCFNGEEKRYLSIRDLLIDLRTPNSTVKLVECLPPSEYDVSPLLLCSVDKDPYKADDGDNSLQGLLSVTQFIDPKELLLYKGNKKEHKGRISIVYRGIWQPEKRKRNKMTKVDIALKVFKSDQHSIEEQLDLMGQWASVQTPALVRLYGLTLRSPRGLVMELLPLGPLDMYLRQHSHQVMDVDLVEAANYLATALWNLEEAGVVHGNIRCHKLLVAAHTDSSFIVRLADPGLTRSYTDNDVHWLAPELYHLKNNAVKSTAADIWAFGTTLWEIFSKGQQPSEKDVDADKRQYGKDLRRMYHSGRRLKGPNGCPTDLYQLMQQCWTLDPQYRKKTQEALRDINRLLYQEFNSRRHSYSVAKPSGPSNKQPEFSEYHKTNTNSPPKGSGDSRATDNPLWLLDKPQDGSTMFSPVDLATPITSLDSVSSIQWIIELEADCNVVLQGRIGQGFYGEVYLGSLDNPNKYGEQQKVAVKRLKANNITTGHLDDFEREIDIMKRLKHENIVEIKAVISEPEVSLVMEYIPRGSLQCYLTINRDCLRPRQLLKFALDVAKGMDYLGQKNIVHRDLAARNILVASETQVKISDFGLAQVMGSNDYYILKTNRELPIKWYAPESLRDGKFSTRSDMWSYGVTMFEMFSLGEDPQLPSLREHSTDQARLLAALDAGVRLPCPATCPNTIYTTIIHPCWLYESHSRPTFKAIAQAIDQLRS